MNVHIRPFTGDDYAAFAALRNAAFPEYPLTVEEWQHIDRHRDPKCRFVRFVAERDGRIVGSSQYGNMTWMFHPQKFYVHVTVHPECEPQGIGRTLYRYLIEQLAPFEPLALRCEVREDMVSAVRFAKRNGFREEMRVWESRLDVQAFDSAPYAQALERTAAQGISIKTFRELEADPDRNHKLHALITEIDRDVPAPEPITPVPFDVWLSNTLEAPSLLPDAFLVALDGDEYVGLSQLWHRQGNNALDNGLTGVKRSHRRKGIALALKVRNILHAQAEGYQLIMTSNESNNRPMLSINERLGFRKQPAWVNFVQIFDGEKAGAR